MLMTYPYTVHFAATEGNCNIAYIDEGRGERTLLFIHGLANYSLCWKRNIDVLKSHYRCIAIDLPGNGLSDRHPHHFSMKFFAETVARFIETLELKNVTLVGHSMGGQIALTTCLKYPELIKDMVLCAPAGFEKFTAMDKAMYYSSIKLIDKITSDEQSLRKVLEHSFFIRRADENQMMDDLLGFQKSYQHGYYKKMIEGCIKGMIEEPVLSSLILIAQPILVLFGENDGLIPNRILHQTTTIAIAEAAIKQLPNATLQMFPGCGHFVQWEACEAVNESIMKFLG